MGITGISEVVKKKENKVYWIDADTGATNLPHNHFLQRMVYKLFGNSDSVYDLETRKRLEQEGNPLEKAKQMYKKR